MAITRSFRDTIKKRADRDPAFRRAMLARGIAYVLTGDGEDILVGKTLIRDYINATIGFDALAKETGKSKESLMRMLGESGNPTLSNFNLLITPLLENEDMGSPYQEILAAE